MKKPVDIEKLEAAGDKNVYAPGSFCIWTQELEKVLELVRSMTF